MTIRHVKFHFAIVLVIALIVTTQFYIYSDPTHSKSLSRPLRPSRQMLETLRTRYEKAGVDFEAAFGSKTRPKTAESKEKKEIFDPRREIKPIDLGYFNFSQVNIFFIETNKDLAEFDFRAACAFESAAFHNPDASVVVILNAEAEKAEMFPLPLLAYSNIRVVKGNFDDLFREEKSNLSALWRSGQVKQSKHFLQHASDILRLVVLKLFGGVYFDTDVISKAPVPRDIGNFVISQYVDGISNSVLKFSKAHPFLESALTELANVYDGNRFSFQGPKLLTTLVESLCNVSSQSFFCPWAGRTCPDFKVLPPEVGLGLPWLGWFLLYDSKKAPIVQRMIGESFAVHLWNHMRISSFSPVVRSSHPIYKLMALNCPVTEEKILRYKVNRNRYWN